MTLEQQINVSFQGQEANTLFFEPVYMEPELHKEFRVLPNVTSKRKMGFVSDLEKIVKRYSGCGFNPTGKIDISNRWIETDHAEFALAQCWEEFRDTVYEELMNRGVRFADLTDTLLAEILITRVTEAVKRDNERLAFFGNKVSSSVAYDVTDGLWTVLIPDFVGSGDTPRFNTASGTALAAGDGLDILRGVYDKQSIQLKGLPKSMKKFYVSSDVYDQYMSDIEGGGGGDYGLMMQVNGVNTLFFRGIEVVEKLTWNQITATDLAQVAQHQCLLTSPKNMIMATDIVGGENQIKIWYNEDEEEMRIKGRYKMGFNIVHPSLLAVGY